MTTARPRLHTLVVTAAALAAGAAQAAPADDKGWYAGAAVGRADLDFSEFGNYRQDGAALHVHGGYRLSRHFAIEAAYADQGDRRDVYECPAGRACELESYPQVFERSLRRADITLVATLPLGERFDLFAKAGHAVTRLDQSFVIGLNSSGNSSMDLSDELYGLGGRWHVTPRWSMRLQWDRMERRNYTVHSQWLGVEYRFGR